LRHCWTGDDCRKREKIGTQQRRTVMNRKEKPDKLESFHPYQSPFDGMLPYSKPFATLAWYSFTHSLSLSLSLSCQQSTAGYRFASLAISFFIAVFSRPLMPSLSSYPLSRYFSMRYFLRIFMPCCLKKISYYKLVKFSSPQTL